MKHIQQTGSLRISLQKQINTTSAGISIQPSSAPDRTEGEPMKTNIVFPKLHYQSALVLAIITALLAATGALAATILLDPSFDVDGKVVTDIGGGTDEIRAMAIYPNGRIIVAGYTYKWTDYDFAVARYNSNGTPDTSFSYDGIVTTNISSDDDYGMAITLQPDGRIVVAGTTGTDVALMRYNADGTLDSTFDVDGIVVTDLGGTDIAHAVSIQQDGKILVAGSSFKAADNYYWGALLRYNSNGSLDTTFGGSHNGKVFFNFNQADTIVNAMAIQPDGKIVMVGGVAVGPVASAGPDMFAVRFNSNGSLDGWFGSSGFAVTDIRGEYNEATAMVIQDDGKLLVAGMTGSPESDRYDFALVRYTKDGWLDPTFDWDGIVVTDYHGCNEIGNAVALQMDGRIVMAGEIYCSGAADGGRSDTVPSDYLVSRYNIDGSLDTTFDGDGLVFTNIGNGDIARAANVQYDGKIVLAGNTDGNFSLARYTGTEQAFKSNAPQDGWVLESLENSNVGGIINAASTVLMVGDNAQNKQYRSILSFDTSTLPGKAVITKATLRLRMQAVAGNPGPFATLGYLLVDIKKGSFDNSALETGDFQAAASKNNIGRLTTLLGNFNWYQLVINPVDYTFINLNGSTQFRLRFATDDDNDAVADYIRFFSGDYATATARPTLVIEYYLP
jgi:uncharacterized delta-60 repeat protein